MTLEGVPLGKVMITDLSDLAASAKGSIAMKAIEKSFMLVWLKYLGKVSKDRIDSKEYFVETQVQAGDASLVT